MVYVKRGFVLYLTHRPPVFSILGGERKERPRAPRHRQGARRRRADARAAGAGQRRDERPWDAYNTYEGSVHKKYNTIHALRPNIRA